MNVKRNRKSPSNGICFTHLCIFVGKYRVIVREFCKFENLFEKLKLPEIMQFFGRRRTWEFLLTLRGFKYTNVDQLARCKVVINLCPHSVRYLNAIWTSCTCCEVLRHWRGGIPYTFLPPKLSSEEYVRRSGWSLHIFSSVNLTWRCYCQTLIFRWCSGHKLQGLFS